MKALITGASGGLGAALRQQLAAVGITVLAAGRNTTGKDSIALDLTSNESIHSAAKRVLAEHSDLAILINCSGVFSKEPFEELDFDKLDESFAVNIQGMMKLTSLLLPTIKRNKGDIVNIGSTSSFKTYPEHAVYAATKWGVRAFTEYLQTELKKEPVRVIGIYPGGIATGLFKKAGVNVDTSGFMQPKDVATAILNAIQLPRALEVSELIINRKDA